MLGSRRAREEPLGARYQDVAIVIPCLDEALTVASVVAAWTAALPGAAAWVIDNGSQDATAAAAVAAGATVMHVGTRGKGNAVRAALAALDRPLAVLIDGDATYPPAPGLVDALRARDADMVIGHRLATAAPGSFPGPRRIGNQALSTLFRLLHGGPSLDVLSGARALRVAAVAALPLRSPGFGVEAELTRLALAAGLRVASHPIGYEPRPPGSRSKLRPLQDGLTVLAQIVRPSARA